MKMVITFEITKGFGRWPQLVDVELKSKLEEYGVKEHFACANQDETSVYDMFEIKDPSPVKAFLMNEEVIKLRTEAGVILDSSDVLSTVVKSRFGKFNSNRGCLACLCNGSKTPLREGRIPNPQQSCLRPH